MSNVTQEQCFGSEKLDIFKIRGTKAAITDFAIALGGFVSSRFHVDSDTSLKGRTGCYWTKSDDGHNDALVVSFTGDRIFNYVGERNGGARPVSLFSSINTIPTNGVSGKLETDEDGVEFVYDGYYPQTAPEKDIQAELNRLYGLAEWNRNNRIPEVCEVPDSIDYYIKTIKYKKIDGYRYNGKIYVRMELKQNAILSNGERYSKGDSVWFEVEPIKRLISEQDKITITEKIIFAGVPFNFTAYYKTEDFEKTVIYKFTNEIWDRDVERLKAIVREEEQKVELEISDTQTRKNRELILQNSNPDKNREAIIIQSGNDYRIPTLIRSQSGISNYTDDERAKAKYYIEEIKIINPELAKKYYEKYKKIIENASSDLKIQQDVKNKLDDLIQELREFYNKNIFVSKYVDKINYTINAYKKNASQITIDEMLEKLNRYRMGIFKLIEYASDRDEINEKFAELQAICMTIYYKYYKSEENQNYFKDIKPENTSESICLINYLNSLEIDDSYFIYIIENIDIEEITKNADLFYNAKLWDIVADYYDIIELADAEVVTENQNNLVVAVPNKQTNSFAYKIIAAFRYFIGLFSHNKAKSVIESAVIEEKADIVKPVAIEDQRPVLEQLIDIYKKNGALEFLANLETYWRLVGFSDDLYENYEEKMIMLEGRKIPEGVSKFKITSPEQMWATVCDIVLDENIRNPDKVVFEDENGKASCIMLKGEPFLQSNGEIRQKVMYTIDKQKLEFELILLSKTSKNLDLQDAKWIIDDDVHMLHFLCEIDKLFGTHCIDRYIEDLLKLIDKNLEVKVDLHGTMNYSIQMNKYAEALRFRVYNRSMEDIRRNLRIARRDYYKHVCSQKNMRESLKVKSEDMIPVKTLELLKNKQNKPDDHEH